MRRLVRAAAVTCLLLASARYSSASPGSFVYVAAASSCTIPPKGCALDLYIYDATNSALVTTILLSTAFGASSSGIAVSPDGSRVYVEVTQGALPAIFVVDATRHQLMNPSLFSAPAGKLAVSRDGHILFDADSTGIYLYDTSTTHLITQIPLASGELSPTAVAADPVRDRVYWTTLTACGGNMHAYDTTLQSELPLQSSPYGWLDAFVSRPGTRLYLTAQSIMCATNSGGDVRIVDPATLTTLSDFRSGSGLSPVFPRGTVDAPTSQRAYVWDLSAIAGHDSNTFATAGQISVAGVTSIAVAADESRAYATTGLTTQNPAAANSLTAIDLTSNAVASVIPLPGTPTNAVATPPAPASSVCSYRLDTHQSSWSVNGGSATVALTTNCAWAASSSSPWAHVTLQSGSGNAALTISVDPNFTTTNRSATVTVGGQIVTVTQASFSATAPFGTIDTPADNASGLNGAIAVMGWALDDVGVTAVRIFRDPVAPEPAGNQIFIGNATLVDGARPDVQAAYPSYPYASRAGWGLQVLTNMLPNGGTGTYRLYAYADDVEGHTTLLGFRTISTDNRTATLPFGTIDTPGQGATVSGTVINFGWALSANLIAQDGSTIDVFVDGVAVGHPVYNNFRGDIAASFPGFPNSNGAIGYFILDTTALANGVHTIVWVVRDSTGATQGIGSRFFTVLN